MNSENEINSISDKPLLIEENGKIYFWSFYIKDESLSININIIEKVCETYQIKKNFEEFQKIHYVFSIFKNIQKIKDFFINAINKKDININLVQNKLLLEINTEVLYEKQVITIELTPKEINKDELIKQLCNIIMNMKKGKLNEKNEINKELENQKSEVNNLKNEIIKINQIMNELKDSYNILEQCNLYGSSILRNKEEIDLLKMAIKQRLGKEFKYLKLLYKASSDGEEATTFHKFCDNIENTISFIKTGGYRRFGGFTTQTWNQVNSYTKTDQHAFVFSLDKLKIYPYTNNGRAIRCDNNYHPTFGVGDCDFRLCGKPLSNKTLYTHQTSGDRSYNYYGDGNALSEDGNRNCISTIEIEFIRL